MHVFDFCFLNKRILPDIKLEVEGTIRVAFCCTCTRYEPWNLCLLWEALQGDDESQTQNKRLNGRLRVYRATKTLLPVLNYVKLCFCVEIFYACLVLII